MTASASPSPALRAFRRWAQIEPLCPFCGLSDAHWPDLPPPARPACGSACGSASASGGRCSPASAGSSPKSPKSPRSPLGAFGQAADAASASASVSAAAAGAGVGGTASEVDGWNGARRRSSADATAAAAAAAASAPSPAATNDPRRSHGPHAHAERCFNFDAYRAAANEETSGARGLAGRGAAPPQPKSGAEAALARVRRAVSQKKVRFQDDGFDLDLTYITPNIIAMGFPSSGREAYFRNPMDAVERFFATRHPKKFRVYNLCAERVYDNSRFGGRFRHFPFQDHCAPCPIRFIPDLCRDVQEFLLESDEHVVALHCKAGKGRTGLMVSCVLMLLNQDLRAPSDALQYFSEVRTSDSKGVTVPSQIRYVHYWDAMLRDYGGREPPPRTLALRWLRIHSTVRPADKACPEVYIVVIENNVEKIDSRRWVPSRSCAVPRSDKYPDGGFLFDFTPFAANGATLLTGDVRFEVWQRNALLSDERVCHFWLNMSLCTLQETLSKKELDGACKDKRGLLHPQLGVTVGFSLGVASAGVRPGGGSGGLGGSFAAASASAASSPVFLAVSPAAAANAAQPASPPPAATTTTTVTAAPVARAAPPAPAAAKTALLAPSPFANSAHSVSAFGAGGASTAVGGPASRPLPAAATTAASFFVPAGTTQQPAAAKKEKYSMMTRLFGK